MSLDSAAPALPRVNEEFTIDFQILDDRIFRHVGIGKLTTTSELLQPACDEVPGNYREPQALWDYAEMRGSHVRALGQKRRHFKLRYADLFAGCGGLSYGVQQAATAAGCDSRSELAVDMDPYALSIYRRNIDVNRCEVIDLSLESPSIENKIDLLIGGPPCQGHSNLNNHTRRLDDRDELYLEMPKFAATYNIPLVAIENVPAIVSSHKSIVERAQELFHEHKYQVDDFVMDASRLGVAQTRKRHFMFASRIGMPRVREIYEKLATTPRPLSWAIEDLRRTNKSFMDCAAQLSETNRHRIQAMFENGWFNLPNNLRPPSHRNGTQL